MASQFDEKVLKGAQLEYLLSKIKEKFDSDEEALIAIMQALDLKADWNQTNPDAYDYIKNKPAITGSGNDVIIAGKASAGEGPTEVNDLTTKSYVDNKVLSDTINLIVETEEGSPDTGVLTVVLGR